MNYSLKFDEYASLFFASQSFGRLWSDWMVRETNPPLYYSLLKGWISLSIPMEPFWLRLPSIFGSVLAIAAVYVGINRIYGPKAAGLAALMLALSGHQIYYAHQMRGYGFEFLALAISFLALLHIVTSIEKREHIPVGAWAAYAGGAITAVYLHTTAIFWPAIATASLMIVVLQSRRAAVGFWLGLAFANLAILLFSSWWIYITYLQFIDTSPNISWIKYSGVYRSLKYFADSSFLLRDTYDGQRIVLFAFWGLAAFGLFRTYRMMATRLAACCGSIAVIAYILISTRQPIITEATIVWIAIFPLTLAAAGLATIRRRSRFWGASAAVVVVFAVNLALADPFESGAWESSIAAVVRDRSGALVVGSEGFGVVTNEACKLSFGSSECPFPVVTLKNRCGDTWASNYAPKASSDEQNNLSLPVRTRFYFIQSGTAQPLRDFQEVGVSPEIPKNWDFLGGPYDGMVSQLKTRAKVQDGLLILSRASLPALACRTVTGERP